MASAKPSGQGSRRKNLDSLRLDLLTIPENSVTSDYSINVANSFKDEVNLEFKEVSYSACTGVFRTSKLIT